MRNTKPTAPAACKSKPAHERGAQWHEDNAHNPGEYDNRRYICTTDCVRPL